MDKDAMEKINFACRELLDFLILNLLWILCTLLGLGVFGFAPSTIALLTVERDKIMKEEKEGVIKRFWHVYKSEFVNGNKIGLILIAFAFMIYVNISNFQNYNETFFVVLYTISVIAKWILMLIGLYVFPMYVHYDTNLLNYFSKSITLMLFKPLMTICIILWCWLMYSLFTLVPGIIVVVGISLFAYGVMAINYQMFMRNENRLKRYKR